MFPEITDPGSLTFCYSSAVALFEMAVEYHKTHCTPEDRAKILACFSKARDAITEVLDVPLDSLSIQTRAEKRLEYCISLFICN